MPKVSDSYLEERRRTIVEAACRVFSEKGMKAATMAEVAVEAGITPGAIYRYFPSKDDLARECLDQGGHVVAQTWRGKLGNAATPLTAFAQLSRQAFEEMTGPGHEADTVLMLENIIDAVRSGDSGAMAMARDNCQPIIDVIREALEAAQRAGTLDASLEAGPLAESLMAFYYGARILRLLYPDMDILAQLAQVNRLLGIEPAP